MILGEIKIVDLISLLVIFLSILASTWRGFLKEFLTITIWIISYFLSTILFKYVISYSKIFIQIEVLANLISWITPFVASVIILSILNRIFIYPLVLKYSNLFDHILGAFFGLVRGVILLSLVFIFIIYLIEDIDKLPLTLNDTYSVKICYSFSKLILPILPVEKLDYFEKDLLP